MENLEEIDFRKWLVFSKLIQNTSLSNEFEKAINKKKSFKNISITKKSDAEGNTYFYISEDGNNSVLKIEEQQLSELKSYFSKSYTNPIIPVVQKTNHTNIKSRSTIQSYTSRRDTNRIQPPRYLFNQNKLVHGIIFSAFTILMLQVVIIPRVVLDMDFGIIRTLFTYGASFVGLWFCFKYYDQYSEYELDYSDVFIIIWSFNSTLFFIYISEVTWLSIPSVIPNLTWTSTILIGTIILGQVYILIFSFIFAVFFYLLRKRDK